VGVVIGASLAVAAGPEELPNSTDSLLLMFRLLKK
jgi:hypothetical protein